jgi:hypothetical protein
MVYTKPQLLGYRAIAAIQEIGLPIKQNDLHEPRPHQDRVTDPAYQADE